MDARKRIAEGDPSVIDMRSWYAEAYREIDQEAGEGLIFSWVGLQICLAQLHVADYEGKRHIVAAHSLPRNATTDALRRHLEDAGLRRQSITRQIGTGIRRLLVAPDAAPSAAVSSIVMHTRRSSALWISLEMRAYGLTSEHMRLSQYRDQVGKKQTGFIDPGRLTVTVPPTGPVTFVQQGSLEEASVEPKPVNPGMWSGIAGSVSHP